MIPPYFCWTRFGTEAGEDISQIVARKEIERQRNGGIFLWGVGNAIGRSLRELLRRSVVPEVLFSPIRSAPKLQDVQPNGTKNWSSAYDLVGNAFRLPVHSTVTSRTKPKHYALVCYSDEVLKLDFGSPTLAMTDLRNILSGRRVGTFQITSVVRYTAGRGGPYPIAMRATLVEPFFVELRD